MDNKTIYFNTRKKIQNIGKKELNLSLCFESKTIVEYPVWK